MDWFALLIPLIALVVWVLASVFQKIEETRIQKDMRRPVRTSSTAKARMGEARPRRTVSELDRFLSEKRERRETPSSERPRKTLVVAEREEQQPEKPARPAGPPARLDTPVTPAMPSMPAMRAMPVLAEFGVGKAGQISRPAREQRTPVMETLASLLQDRDSLAVAFILQDVFGPPACKRIRRPGPPRGKPGTEAADQTRQT